LRHTFGIRLVREGHDPVLVVELMGHARIETTRGYSLPTDAAAASRPGPHHDRRGVKPDRHVDDQPLPDPTPSVSSHPI
jgi:integrase